MAGKSKASFVGRADEEMTMLRTGDGKKLLMYRPKEIEILSSRSYQDMCMRT